MNKFLEDFKKYQETEEAYTEASIFNMQSRVYDLLEKNKIKKAHLAKKIGITRQQLNDFFIKGNNATLKTIGKIAYALNKKAVISFVDKDIDNRAFYDYIRSYKINSMNLDLEKIYNPIKHNTKKAHIYNNLSESFEEIENQSEYSPIEPCNDFSEGYKLTG